MKNKYMKSIAIVIAICIVTGIVLKMKISKIDNDSQAKNQNIDVKGSEGEENIASKFIEDGEMRGVWVSTVSNLDWPEVGNYDVKVQKELLKEKFDFIEEQNMNTIFFQVRPMGDALYESSYAPWSKYLTGTLWENPGYDPLEFAIDEAHKRGLELQAWFNPFRIDSNSEKFNIDNYIDELPEESPLKNNPDWIVKYNNYHYLDAGIPEVREYVIDTIIEVVKNYNIDGVVLDDYFYPYPSGGVEFPDEDTYEKYGEGFSSKDEWRRNNIDCFISELYSKIKNTNAEVKFGVSPFGIWRNGESVGGSNTSGLSSYDDVYVDSRKWIQEGWIDYIIPQIYWQFDYNSAPFATLVDWWAKQVENTNVELYIGHAAYKINDSSYGEAWLNGNEVINQIRYSRANSNVKGNCFFRLKTLEENRLGFTDKLKELYTR
ncbi:family 10 glycosylhydrolase [Clostridium saudiense]|uniref:Family 10 glycosylhydrolase n=1 Tax=Clostridium saudiense TaxID=1414720 RepID=A0ABS2FG40_9CLOT|nr:family 10 glycosylhydrolase [Clostridium saudiense]MBM6818898.1 family 10 glycosylhydrolase [Clostridium saudiense]